MARCDVLVSADWAESNLHAPKFVDEDTRAYDRDHIAGAAIAGLGAGARLCKSVNVDQQFSMLSERGIANEDTAATTTGSPPTRTGISSSTAMRRSVWTAAASGSSTDARCPATVLHRLSARETGHSATRSWRPSTSRSTCALPTSSPARWPRACTEQSQGRVPGAINVPWSRAANEDGTFKSDEELAKLYADAANSKETIAFADRGTVLAHLVGVAGIGHQNVKKLRRQLDRIRLLVGTRSGWEADMCSGPKQGLTLPASVDLEKETVITGRVVDGDGQYGC